MEKLGSGLKKVLLAGIGAVAVTGEKSKELLDEMVKKGELTVEQGKALNEELKHEMEKKQEEFEAAETVEDVADESVCEDAAEKAAEEETAENEDI